VSASEYTAEMQRRLQAQDKVRFKLHAMGTELEGEPDQTLDDKVRSVEQQLSSQVVHTRPVAP